MSEKKEMLSEDFSEVFQDTIADIPRSQEDVVQNAEREYEVARREQILREKDDQIRRLNEVHGMRKKFLTALFVYLCGWSVVVVAVVWVDGFCVAFEMSDAVEITLLSTTLAQVIGITIVAFKWLFPKKD